MDSKVGLQNTIQDLLLCGDARHDFVYLSYYGTKEGGSTEEKKDAEDLQAVMTLTCNIRHGQILQTIAAKPTRQQQDDESSRNPPARLAWLRKYLLRVRSQFCTNFTTTKSGATALTITHSSKRRQHIIEADELHARRLQADHARGTGTGKTYVLIREVLRTHRKRRSLVRSLYSY
jgi:hypothetical protein